MVQTSVKAFDHTAGLRRLGPGQPVLNAQALAQPVASVAAVALAKGLNDNLVHKWRRRTAEVSRSQAVVSVAGEFIAPPMLTQVTPASQPRHPHRELRRRQAA